MRGEKRQCSLTLSVTAVLSATLLFVNVSPVISMTGDHGGVPMGKTNVCDDAVTNIALDWDPSSSQEYTCDTETITPTKQKSKTSCEKKPKEGIHVCYPQEITYEDIPPTSGRHRPNWADYGEYTYVPPQRWLHDLEHGAIVMLYHPCVDDSQVDALRNIVTGCLRKHIITPSKLLPRETPFALLSWGCKLTMGLVDHVEAYRFILEHAKNDAPEGKYAKSGKYNQSMIEPARIVSDFDDSVICPSFNKNELDVTAGDIIDLTNMDQQQNNMYDPRRNPIIQLSQKRRQKLAESSQMMHNDIQRLIKVYRRLVAQNEK